MTQEQFKAETKQIEKRTKGIFNALVTVTEKRPKLAVWLVIVLALAAAFLAIKGCVKP